MMYDLVLTLFLLSSTIIYVFVRNTNKGFIFVYAILLSFIFSIRPEHYPDYQEHFDFFNGSLCADMPCTFGYGYYLFQSVFIYFISNSFQFFLFTISAIFFSISLLIPKNLNLRVNYYPLIFYITFVGVSFNLVTPRTALAYSFFILSVVNFRRGFILSLLLFIVAFYFHYTVIFGVIAFVIFNYSNYHTDAFYYRLLFISIFLFFLRPSQIIFDYTRDFLALIIPDRHIWDLDRLTPIFLDPFFIYLIFLSLFFLKLKRFFTFNYVIYYPSLNVFLLGVFFYAIFSDFFLVKRLSFLFLIFSYPLLLSFYTLNSNLLSRFFLLFPLLINLFFSFSGKGIYSTFSNLL